MNNSTFISEYSVKLDGLITFFKELKEKEYSLLTYKENPNAWSILDCVEHLNLYNVYYIPKIESCIRQGELFRNCHQSGFISRWMIAAIENSRLRMKTAKEMNPIQNVDTHCIEKFLTDLQHLQVLLLQSRNVDLNQRKIISSISKLIRLNLGDAFIFLIAHINRHRMQIEKILYSGYHQI